MHHNVDTKTTIAACTDVSDVGDVALVYQDADACSDIVPQIEKQLVAAFKC